MRIQARDQQILESLHNFQCLTTEQINSLFFGNIKTAQRRLRKLVTMGLLNCRPIPTTKGNSPNLFFIAKGGAILLGIKAVTPRIGWQLSHQMKNSSLLIRVISEFQNRPIDCSALPESIVRRANLTVIPDATFCLTKQDKSAMFFIENDSDTEIIRSKSYHSDLDQKVLSYVDMFVNNSLAFYTDHFQQTFNRFRVLFITNTEKRLEAASNLIKSHDEHGFIWIKTLSDFEIDPIGGWTIPALDQDMQSII